MGACQGRVCGPALEFLFGWPAGTVRRTAGAGPPVYALRRGVQRIYSESFLGIMTMEQRDWAGVFSAITTPFRSDLLGRSRVSSPSMSSWLVDSGCTGIVALGSLGESATLSFDEKVAILESCRSAVGGRVPVVAGIAGLSTAECVALAQRAAASRLRWADGASGRTSIAAIGVRREAHFSAVIDATSLSCMLYNNPIAYGTDVTAEQLAELARHDNLHAVKESSGDVRRVTAVVERLGERLNVFAGLDDMIVESVSDGRVGVDRGSRECAAGGVGAPVRSGALAGNGGGAPPLRVVPAAPPADTLPKFVQLIKLAQVAVGQGERPRASAAPRGRRARIRRSNGVDPRAIGGTTRGLR